LTGLAAKACMKPAKQMIEPDYPHGCIADWLGAHAAEKQALVFEDGRSWTYGALDAWAQSLSGYLSSELGIKRGGRVAFLGFNDPAMIALLFACARIGAILVPLNWRLTPAELSWICAKAAPDVLIHDGHFADAAGEVADGTCPMASVDAVNHVATDPARKVGTLDDPLLLVYTSGTTGRPKGAVLTQRAVQVNAFSSVDLHQFTPNDKVLVVLPIFHVGGLNITLTPALFSGACVYLHARFDPQSTLDAIQQIKPEILVMVPATMQAIMVLADWDGADLTCFRMLSAGSMIVPPDLIGAWEARGVSVVIVYGSTETCPIAGYTRPGDGITLPQSTGRAGIYSEIRISGEGGSDGETGEIEVRGAHVMTCYWRDEDETAAAFDGDWFRTGDLGYLRRDGHLVVRDRRKNLIISGGENIYPAEIERVIGDVAGISECCVVGKVDQKWGAVPAVAIVLCPGADSEVVGPRMRQTLEQQLAHFKHPRVVHFVGELPRNALGKIIVDEVKDVIATLEK
jgi:fatty-acyl-CoA synthase